MSYLALTASLSGGPAGVVLLLVFIAVICTLLFVGSRMLRGESRNVDAAWRYRWRRPLGARRPGQDDLDAVTHVPSGLLRWRPLFGRRNTEVEDSILQAQYDCGCPLCLQVIAESVQSASSTS